MVKYPENNNFQQLLESQAHYYRKSMVSGTHHRELKILVMAGDFTASVFQMWMVGSHCDNTHIYHLFRLLFLSPIHFLASFFLLLSE